MNIEDIKNKKKVFIDFYADWCGPCQKMLPIVNDLKAELQGDIEILKINIDDEIDIITHFEIMSVPTFLYLEDGIEKFRTSGLKTKKELLNIIN